MKHTLLLAHGSRDPLWTGLFEKLLVTLRQQHSQKSLSLAFFEMAPPSIDTAIEDAVNQHATHIQILPLFFAIGRHLRHDIPDIISRLETQYPSIKIELLAPVGEHPAITSALSQIVGEL